MDPSSQVSFILIDDTCNPKPCCLTEKCYSKVIVIGEALFGMFATVVLRNVYEFSGMFVSGVIRRNGTFLSSVLNHNKPHLYGSCGGHSSRSWETPVKPFTRDLFVLAVSSSSYPSPRTAAMRCSAGRLIIPGTMNINSLPNPSQGLTAAFCIT